MIVKLQENVPDMINVYECVNSWLRRCMPTMWYGARCGVGVAIRMTLSYG